ncbi:MAG: site-specific integrase, partial [Gammaproteobacteria bacterium]
MPEPGTDRRGPAIESGPALPLPATMDAAIQRYIAHLRTERRSSPHTIRAYRRDLNAFARRLSVRGVTDFGAASPHDVREMVAPGPRELANTRS